MNYNFLQVSICNEFYLFLQPFDDNSPLFFFPKSRLEIDWLGLTRIVQFVVRHFSHVVNLNPFIELETD